MFGFLFFLIFLLSGYITSTIFINFWIKTKLVSKVPKGVGAFIPLLFLFFGGLVFDLWFNYWAILALALGTMIYFLDDIFELRISVRTAIILITAVACLYFIGVSQNLNLELDELSTWIFGTLIFFFLVNVSNFYDGADLNLSTFIILFSLSSMIFGTNTEIFWFSLAFLGFVVGFSVHNIKPRRIYMGDAGSFAFAGLIFLQVLNSFGSSEEYNVRVFFPLALPIFDVLFVVGLRIIKRENILTRNYWHLYQRVQSIGRGFEYLGPQILNLLLCLFIYEVFLKFNWKIVSAAFSAVLVATLLSYSLFYIYFFWQSRVTSGAGHDN